MNANWRDLFQTFGRIGLLSFGGPAAQIALMHRVLVDEKKWLTEKDYLSGLSFCMVLPGPEAMQLATYAGWRLRGVAGGLLAGLLFVLPGAFLILALASAYVAFGDLPWVRNAFLGVQAAVVVIVIEALLKVSKRALKKRESYALAALSFIGIYALGLPFPAIVLAAGLWGYVRAQPSSDEVGTRLPPLGGTLRTAMVWGLIWWLPLLALPALGADFLWDIALFFSQLAVVTFGGAYAVLAWMAQWAVETQGWLTTAQMIDALGLAETTPGPLILVTEFVAFLAGWGAGGWGLAISAALVSLWATFVPCFLWIFAGAPYLGWIAARPRLQGALSAIIAAVVGVILNLSLWFALHVLFSRVTASRIGPLPDLSSLDPISLALTLIAAALLLWWKRGLLETLAVLAVLGGIVRGIL
ncbi:MAG: chromate efflux transporter [Rhodobacteraceae bacterium]|nr:chromate efflux transporter [Paracoccaceae bacterium]